jgi:hypothetical protein
MGVPSRPFPPQSRGQLWRGVTCREEPPIGDGILTCCCREFVQKLSTKWSATGYGVIKRDDLTHALHGFGYRIVHALDAAAKARGLRQGCDFHSGQSNVDAEDGRPVNLRHVSSHLAGVPISLSPLGSSGRAAKSSCIRL